MTVHAKPEILLVDDDRDMCESLSDVLSLDSTYSVTYCIDPLKVLEMLKTRTFALIILDYKMPGMNGMELIKEIIKFKPDSVIFMLTAFISTELINQAKKEGAVKVLSKFIWPDKILSHIKETLS
ncbi:MAG: response regulator [Candidatus Omnitrophota bacterium]